MSHRRIFALVAVVLGPLLAFALLETALRLAGYGYDTAFFKKIRIHDRDFLVNNDKFVLRFFPPQLARLPGALRMPAEKPPDTCRIFILGESAALGDPSPPYGAGRLLQAMLSARFPAKKFEVVNVSVTAINSHVIVPIARECARHDGDFWIVYMGNNEMVGPFGAATIFGAQAPPLWAVRLNLAVQQTRVGQLLMSAARQLHFKSAKSASWAGMEMFVGNELPPDDPRKQRVYENFEQNLHDILDAGLSSGARIILNTVAVNLKDCSPFASANPIGPIRTSTAAEEFAQAHYQKACDDDALPFRADSRINGIIRQAGHQASSNLVLLDSAALLAVNDPAGVCGDETFFEHVHFNFNGNYLLARAWADAIAPLLPVKPTEPDWLSQPACEQRVGLTDWNRMLTLSEVIRRWRQPPLNSLSNQVQELEKFTAELSSLRGGLNAAGAARARALFLEDIQRDPDDYLLRFDFGDFLEGVKDWKEAANQWRQVQELLPQYYLAYFQEGRMLEHAGQLGEAESAFNQSVALYPRMTAAWFELGNIHTSEGKYESALQDCERARALEPEQPIFTLCKGKILSRMNRPAAAMEQFRQAIAIRPDYLDAHLALAGELSRANQLTEAVHEFQEVLRLSPGNQAAREALASLQH